MLKAESYKNYKDKVRENQILKASKRMSSRAKMKITLGGKRNSSEGKRGRNIGKLTIHQK